MAATKETKAGGATKAKAAPKSKVASTSKVTKSAASPTKSRKRAVDAVEVVDMKKMDEPVKQAKKDAAKKAKAKVKEEEAAAAAAAAETNNAADVVPPKAKKAKTSKAAATKAEESETKPKAVPKKKTAAKKDADEAKKPAAKTSDAAPKPKKRKASTVEEVEGKAKAAVATAAKKQKISEETAVEAQSLLGLVGSSLQAASKRMSGLFTVLGASGSDGSDGAKEKEKKKPATKKSGTSKAKATPSGEETAVDAAEEVLERADSDSDLQDDDDPAAAILRGFASSSDEEEGGEDAAPGDEGFAPGRSLPALPRAKQLSKKLQGAAAKKGDGPGVVYIGRIPHGFHEHEMRAYFSQFGPVDHVRLSRSRKTGASKHYAFLQFASAAVARIAAETMHNYLLFGHILKVRVIPPEQVHPQLFVGADRRFRPVPRAQRTGRKLAQPQGRSVWQARVDAESRRRVSKGPKLEALGYDFTPPALKDAKVVSVQAKEVVAVDANAEVPARSTDVVVKKAKGRKKSGVGAEA